MSLKGKLLVATPPLTDPNFDRTVVLLLEHGDDGAFGVVLNRPSPTTMRGQLPEWDHLLSAPAQVYVGGPVQPDAVIALGLAAGPAAVETAAFTPVFGRLGTVDLTVAPDELGVGLVGVRVFAGYSGWGAGQLESELAQDAWFVADAAADDAFSAEPSELWWTVLGRQPGELAWLRLFPEDLSAN